MPLNHFGAVGLGTRKYQQDQSPVKVCQEMLLPGCDCCRIGPCKLCLTWTVGTKIYLGKASGDGQEWSGSAGNVSFRAYWDESYCTINVELDGELVWTRSLCEDYDAVTCRNWDDETAFTTYAGDSGTFAWEVTEFLELLRRPGGEAYSESECADYFCGTCSCTCPKLCVTITTDETGCEGTIPFTGEQCDDGRVTSPEWSGAIDCEPDGSVDVAIALTRDAYGDCQISGTVDGTIGGNAVALALVETPITDCKALTATWTVTVGDVTYTVAVQCLECGECGPPFLDPCCPDVVAPTTLTATLILQTNSTDPTDPSDVACDDQVEVTFGFSRKLRCPICCDDDGAPQGPVETQDPLTGFDVYDFHGGFTTTLNGISIEICVVACIGQLTPESKPTPASDAPEDQYVAYMVVLNDGFAVESRWTTCSPVGFVVDWGTTVGTVYCPENLSGDSTVILVVTE